VRPFFSYYGAKWNGAKHYGPPRHNLVIEPFAGAACYSTRWDCPRVRLYDVSRDICDMWSWLISCNVDDILRIPDTFEDYAEVLDLDRGPQMLARFWVSKGRAEPSNTLSPWYFQWRGAQGRCPVCGLYDTQTCSHQPCARDAQGPWALAWNGGTPKYF